ncbi:MAG: nucleotide pyrophosphohydrolase [Longimicrobiales bacterium]
MEITEAQARVDEWVMSFEEGYWPPLAILARLVEEVGELSRELNHRFGSKPKRSDEAAKDLALEIGDVLFVLISLANQQDIDLEGAFRGVMEKYKERDSERWTPVVNTPSTAPGSPS